MIHDIILQDTPVWEMDAPKFIVECGKSSGELKALAKEVSLETGVPRCNIYKSPHYVSYLGNWIKIDGEWYYYKRGIFKSHFVNELLGEMIAQYFDLDTINYTIVKFKYDGYDDYGLLAKNFCNPNIVYKDAEDMKIRRTRDLSVIKKVRRICKTKEEYEKLASDLKKLFIMDFLSMQTDRHVGNFLFKCGVDGVRLAPLYDYEGSFFLVNPYVYKNAIGTLNTKSSATKKLLLQDDVFQELLYKLMDFDMHLMVEELLDKYKLLLDEELENNYYKSVEVVKKVVRRTGIIR